MSIDLLLSISLVALSLLFLIARRLMRGKKKGCGGCNCHPTTLKPGS